MNNNINLRKSTNSAGSRPKRALRMKDGGRGGNRPRTDVRSRDSQGNLVPDVRYAPVAMSKNVRTRRPDIRGLRNGDCRVVHKEYIQDIVASAGSPSPFKNTLFPINAGNANTFPWLSSIAQRFESFNFNRLRFCFETEAPSSLGGTLVMVVDYDVTDTPAASKTQALTYRNAVRSAPWTPCCMESDPEDLHKLKSYFVSTGFPPQGTDPKFYNVGLLQVISQGVTTSAATLGELYVEYDVTLMTPALTSFNVFAYAASTTGCSTGSFFAADATSGGNLNITSSTGGTIAAGGNNFALSGLSVGGEYSAAITAFGASVTTISFTSGTGMNLLSFTGNVSNDIVLTFTATNPIATFSIVATGSASKSFLTVGLISSPLGF